nr:RNA-directed DNA polymerase, eukaryota, reverse transcriptase zinc-binding domain protein [Tanacetum cinerariifolium]
MKAFHGNKSVGSWFSQIVQAHKEFVMEERVIWVEIERVLCKWWSKNTFNRIESRWGNLLNAEELEEGGYHSNRLCIRTKMNMAVVESFKMVYREGESDSEAIPETRFKDEPIDKFDDINSIPHSKPQSEDLFGVYELLNKKKKVTNNEGESQNSPTYPPRFIPNDNAGVNTSNAEPVERGHNGDKEEGDEAVGQSGGILSAWDPNKFQKLNHTISDYCTLVRGVWVPNVLDRREGIDTDVTRRSDVVRILQDIEKTEAMEMAQKAKIKWAVEGDENSKYYHDVINKKRNNLAIRGVLVNDNWVESPQLVKNEFYAHFKQRFEKPNLSGIQFDREFPNKICSEQAIDLEREVSKEEVKRAVWDCRIDKAPGPDGFTFGFYRRFWNLIECDVVKDVKWFFLHERIPSGGNSSFITLIPKVSNANMVKYFRPISLIGSVYEIVAKILANRLILVLGDLVSDTKSAFLKERQILDGLFILNEVIQWWDFVDTILKMFGFRDKWCKWINSYLQSSRVMESLNLSFQRVVEAGLLSRIKLDSSMSVSHLFYADDAIFMGQWNQSNIDTIVRVLKVFHSASGLCINIKKSKLMGISVDASRVE